MDSLRCSKISPNPASYTRKYPWKPSLILDKIQAKRRISSAFYQLKIGHGYIKSYLYNIGRSSNDKCQCGRRETAEHLLLGCPEYRVERAALRGAFKQPLSLQLLLHTKEGRNQPSSLSRQLG